MLSGFLLFKPNNFKLVENIVIRPTQTAAFFVLRQISGIPLRASISLTFSAAASMEAIALPPP
jgi:hypothetical protein